VIDAGGSPTQIADDISARRMSDHGITITITGTLLAELVDLWSEGDGVPIGKILQEEILSQIV
jgi:hypothetical protein